MRGVVALLLWPLVVIHAAASAYLATLTALALVGSRHCNLRASRSFLRLAVVIPAHNEEVMLPRLLSALALQTFPRDRYKVHVLADNCNDETAAIARRFGAAVEERHQPERPGKGQAIAWLLPSLLETDADAFIFIDADSTVDPQFLQIMACRLADGSIALQASYRVADADNSPLVALRAIAFALMHDVRGRAKSRLGVSCGLWGNGMALHREAIICSGWRSFSSVEDAEQHVRLVLAGRKVTFVPEARVYGHMPSTFQDATGQQKRWEAGRLSLLRTWWAPLLRAGLIKRNGSAALALCDLALPPLSVVVAGNLVLAAGAWLFGPVSARVVALASAGCLAAHVLSGLAISELKPRSYFALFQAPRYALWKVRVYGREMFRRADSAWVRTAR